MTTGTDEILLRLKQLHPRLIDLSLDRMQRLLAALGNPERQLPPVVHIAGTNGKGSTTAMLGAMLKAAGLAVHTYTSPHLVSFNERINLNGAPICDDELDALLRECERANDGAEITFFEITTAAAFLAFARNKADVLILETGLGGRLDATNVVDQPVLTCITPVSMDHQHFLGNTLEEIMAEKAGILKPGVPCISAAQSGRAMKVLEEKAKEKSARLMVEGRDWYMQLVQGELVLVEGTHKTRLPVPALAGHHQLQNAGVAVQLAMHLGRERGGVFDIPLSAIQLGLKSAQWPARLEHLATGRLAEIAGAGWEIWLDGGHNPSAARMLSRHTRTWRKQPLYMIFGALNTRPVLEFLKPFEGRIQGIWCVAVPGEENSLHPLMAVEAGRSLNMDAHQSQSVVEALRDITANHPTGRVLITGSLYLAGAVLAENRRPSDSD